MQLPDFEDMVRVSEEIQNLSTQKGMLEIEIKIGEGDVFRRAQIEEKYFVNGKPASTTAIENTYKYSGLDNELIPKRKELVSTTALLDRTKEKLELMKIQIEVWRSEQANQRISLAP